MLPGALLPNEGLRFLCRQVELEVVSAATAATSACGPGERLSIPVKHMSGRWFAPPAELAELERERADRVPLRGRPEPERLDRRRRRGRERARQRRRADAPPRARGRSADRLGRWPALFESLREARRRLRREPRRRPRPAAGARTVRRRRRALWHDAAAADARRPSRARDPGRDPFRSRADRSGGGRHGDGATDRRRSSARAAWDDFGLEPEQLRARGRRRSRRRRRRGAARLLRALRRARRASRAGGTRRRSTSPTCGRSARCWPRRASST